MTSDANQNGEPRYMKPKPLDIDPNLRGSLELSPHDVSSPNQLATERDSIHGMAQGGS